MTLNKSESRTCSTVCTVTVLEKKEDVNLHSPRYCMKVSIVCSYICHRDQKSCGFTTQALGQATVCFRCFAYRACFKKNSLLHISYKIFWTTFTQKISFYASEIYAPEIYKYLFLYVLTSHTLHTSDYTSVLFIRDSSLQKAIHHCTFSIITYAHFVHHFTLKQALFV